MKWLPIILLICSQPCQAETLIGGVQTKVQTFQLSAQSFHLNDNRVKLSQSVERGIKEVGVLGAVIVSVDPQDRPAPQLIRRIGANSHLRACGIQEGDLILSVNGRYGNTDTIRNLTRGVPGTPMSIVFQRGNHQMLRIVRRVPASCFLYDGTDVDGYFQWCAQQTEKW